MAESSGLWLDKDSGKVVKKQPARGRQLVAPGKDVDAAEVKAVTSRYDDSVETATVSDDTEKAVSTTTVKSAPAKSAAKKK